MTPSEICQNYEKQLAFWAKQSQLREVKKSHSTSTDRSSKIQLTKQIKALEIEVDAEKDSFEFIHTISPEKVIERVESKLNQIVNNYQEALANFIERLQQNAADAISWGGNNIVSEEEKSNRATAILKFMSQKETAEEKIEAYLHIFNHIKEEGMKEILRHAQRSGSKSTSQYHNIVEDSKICGLAELFEDWQLGEVEYYLDMINNYKILKEAGLLTELDLLY